MSNSVEIRWGQRFENFHKAVMILAAACEQDGYSDLERTGLVQTFEFSFKPAWDTLEDLLFHQVHDPRTPRETIRTAFTAGYLSKTETATALEALDKRNLLSHSHDEATAEEAVKLIRENYAPMLLALHVRLDAKQSA